MQGQKSSSFKIENTATFCVHKICGPKCETDKIPNNIHAIEERLREKVSEKLEKEKKEKNKQESKNTK